MASIEPGLPSVSYIFTPIIQSITCGGILYGTSLLQAYYYMLHCEEDPTWTKCFVALVFVVETICTALSFCALNHYAVQSIENPEALLHLDWTICATPISINIIHSLVSSYYISRMWLYTKNKPLTVLAASLTAAGTVGFACAQHGICVADTWFEIRLDHKTKVPTIIAMTVFPVADGITALTVAMSLYNSSPKIIGGRMRNVVTWLLVMTVNTGFILVAVGLSTLIVFIKMSDGIAWAGMLLLSGKLYANSLLAMLNGKLALRTKLNSPATLDLTNEVVLTSVYRSTDPIPKSLCADMENATMDQIHTVERPVP